MSGQYVQGNPISGPFDDSLKLNNWANCQWYTPPAFLFCSQSPTFPAPRSPDIRCYVLRHPYRHGWLIEPQYCSMSPNRVTCAGRWVWVLIQPCHTQRSFFCSSALNFYSGLLVCTHFNVFIYPQSFDRFCQVHKDLLCLVHFFDSRASFSQAPPRSYFTTWNPV